MTQPLHIDTSDDSRLVCYVNARDGRLYVGCGGDWRVCEITITEDGDLNLRDSDQNVTIKLDALPCLIHALNLVLQERKTEAQE